MKVEAIDKMKWHALDADISFEQAAVHIAFFLRWCIENDLVGGDMMKYAGEQVQQIKNGTLDCRDFFINNVDGVLLSSDLTEEGAKFAHIYYVTRQSKFVKAYGGYLPDYDNKIVRKANSMRLFFKNLYNEALVPFLKSWFIKAKVKPDDEFLYLKMKYSEKNYRRVKKLLDKRYKQYRQFMEKKGGEKKIKEENQTNRTKKRKTLPKDFSELVERGDIDALKAVFDKCEINAYGGYNKTTALGFRDVPEELVRWLVAQGADINATDDIYKYTPLHHHTKGRYGMAIDVFLELGADVNAVDSSGYTPLHFAAGNAFSLQKVNALIAHGANPLAENKRGLTPLAYALAVAENIDIESLNEIVPILLRVGTPITPLMLKSVERIGKNFEFHREGYNKESVAAVSAALERLYEIFGVTPIEKRNMHDGVSPIIAAPGKLMDQHNELWQQLVPSSGPAKTVQGEVIRITGKIHDEIFRNGACNWDKDFRKMLDALLLYFLSGTALNAALLSEAEKSVKQIRSQGDGDDQVNRLCELAVEWVALNPHPVPLNKTDYDR